MAKHIILFVLTAISTYLVGANYSFDTRNIVNGLSYSCSIMLILLAHEMGHYVMSRSYGIPATLPYFIPFPFSPFGTFGAIIKMKGIIINKKALFDIGVAGPLSSFHPLCPVPFFWHEALDRGRPPAQARMSSGSANHCFLKLIQWITVGELPPTQDILLHPLGYAGMGWALRDRPQSFAGGTAGRRPCCICCVRTEEQMGFHGIDSHTRFSGPVLQPRLDRARLSCCSYSGCATRSRLIPRPRSTDRERYSPVSC